MTAVVVDTHALIWYVNEPTRLSPLADAAIAAAVAGGFPVYVVSISLVEMRYLVEKNRIPAASMTRVEARLDALGSELLLASLDRDVATSLADVARDDVPDMPDRIIAATALQLGVPLVTRDGKIRASGVTTIW